MDMWVLLMFPRNGVESIAKCILHGMYYMLRNNISWRVTFPIKLLISYYNTNKTNEPNVVSPHDNTVWEDSIRVVCIPDKKNEFTLIPYVGRILAVHATTMY